MGPLRRASYGTLRRVTTPVVSSPSPSRLRAIHYYLTGTSAWFLAWGIQSVMFSWLVTMELGEPADKVGMAQMALLLPGLLLMLPGGSLADRYGGVVMAFWGQILAALAPLYLITLLLSDALTFEGMLLFAFWAGIGSALVTPARDGLLNYVAEGKIQRTVLLTSLCQFGFQTAGFLLAAMAEVTSAVVVLALQSVLLASGALSIRRIKLQQSPGQSHEPMLRAIQTGARTVWRIPSMRIIVLQNVAMSLLFMGSFIVSMPLLVREVFSGDASDLSWLYACNSVGLAFTILLILRVGGIERPGRALILTQGIGGLVLAASALMPTLFGVVGVIFLWGACGGVAMTMSRTIMQEQAPPDQRSRVMSFYAFSFMGAGPLGALAQGYLVLEVGPQDALLFSGTAMAVLMLFVALLTSLWQLRLGAPEGVNQ